MMRPLGVTAAAWVATADAHRGEEGDNRRYPAPVDHTRWWSRSVPAALKLIQSSHLAGTLQICLRKSRRDESFAV